MTYKIINERRSVTDGNTFLSSIVEYNDRLFKIVNRPPTQIYLWSGFNGWLYIDTGDSQTTTKDYIDQFLPIMKAYTNEKEN